MKKFKLLLCSKKLVVLCFITVLFLMIIVPPFLNYHTSVDGGFTEWADWSSCFATCGPSVMGRSRTCTNPRPKGNGRLCAVFGPYIETKPCEKRKCPVHGDYGMWTNWTVCVPECRDGKQNRSRECDNPPPSEGGNDCDNKEINSKEERQCSELIPCPIDGGLSEWENWSGCSVSCNAGLKERQRHCNNPEPKYRGKGCSEHVHEALGCYDGPCTTVSSTVVATVISS